MLPTEIVPRREIRQWVPLNLAGHELGMGVSRRRNEGARKALKHYRGNLLADSTPLDID
jgi:hypothetical protein